MEATFKEVKKNKRNYSIITQGSGINLITHRVTEHAVSEQLRYMFILNIYTSTIYTFCLWRRDVWIENGLDQGPQELVLLSVTKWVGEIFKSAGDKLLRVGKSHANWKKESRRISQNAVNC